MAEEHEGHAAPLTPPASGGKTFSKRWMREHWVELLGAAIAVISLLYLYMRSKSSPTTAGFALPGSPAAGPVGGAPGSGGGPQQPVDLSPLLAMLTQSQQKDADMFAQLGQQQQASQAAQSQSLGQAIAAMAKQSADALAAYQRSAQDQMAQLSQQQQGLLQALSQSQNASQAQTNALQAELASVEAAMAKLSNQPPPSPNTGTLTSPGSLLNPNPSAALPASQPPAAPPGFKEAPTESPGLFQLFAQQVQAAIAALGQPSALQPPGFFAESPGGVGSYGESPQRPYPSEVSGTGGVRLSAAGPGTYGLPPGYMGSTYGQSFDPLGQQSPIDIGLLHGYS